MSSAPGYAPLSLSLERKKIVNTNISTTLRCGPHTKVFPILRACKSTTEAIRLQTHHYRTPYFLFNNSNSGLRIKRKRKEEGRVKDDLQSHSIPNYGVRTVARMFPESLLM